MNNRKNALPNAAIKLCDYFKEQSSIGRLFDRTNEKKFKAMLEILLVWLIVMCGYFAFGPWGLFFGASKLLVTPIIRAFDWKEYQCLRGVCTIAMVIGFGHVLLIGIEEYSFLVRTITGFMVMLVSVISICVFAKARDIVTSPRKSFRLDQSLLP